MCGDRTAAYDCRQSAEGGELAGTTIARAPFEGTTIPNPVEGAVTFKATGAETGGTMTVFETVAAPGKGPPLHFHAGEEEAIYVLEGEVDFRLGDDVHRAGPGSFVFVPRGTPHTFRNAGTADARLLIVFTPSGMERFFEDMAAERTALGDEGRFAAIGHEVGLEVVGPPLGDEEG
jgi:quercetin dioxygenase-like cupin family protein